MAFDFGKHVGKKPQRDLTDPIALFHSLDRKTSHTTLRPAQHEALQELHARRGERDSVLKMPTGTGKSSVGLLYLKAKAAQEGRAVVYLCPTKQLVTQVLAEASKLGVKAHDYPSGQSHPHPECMSGEAVIVCTYDKLFNAKTTFDRPDVDLTPAALVLDDAHAGVDKIRDAFSLRITGKKLVKELSRILDGPARQYAVSRWEDLQSGRAGVSSIEIPYWSWREVVPDVRHLLGEHARDREVMFTWPHLQEVLPWCRCVVAWNGIEIVPSLPPVEGVRTYRDADNRIFMSATLADDSVLVRELACGLDAALSPVSPAGRSFGERLVLVPSLIDRSLNLSWVKKVCEKLHKKHHVVVLCSSKKNAAEWEEHGAEVVVGDEVPGAVRRLRSGQTSFVAFANRYDGVDLPDDACRVLVLDGLPLGQGIADSHDGSIRGGFQARTTYRIEQGMGRAVRSDADYAVVILAGTDLASFTAKPEVRDQLSPDARAQIELAFDLPKLVTEDEAGGKPAGVAIAMIKQCLQRAEGWRSFYDERVREAVAGTEAKIDERKVRLGAEERKAAESAQVGNAPKATETLQEAMDTHFSKQLDRKTARRRAYYLQLLASYTHDYDKGTALEIQNRAFEADRTLLRPPAASKKLRSKPSTRDQVAQVLHHYGSFDHANSYLAELESVKVSLSFEASPKRFEEGLKSLAPFLGAEGSRPEEELGEGPDDLIHWAALSLVIEAKNDAEYSAVPKKDAEQLLHSMEWFAANYPALKSQARPILACEATKTRKGVHLPKDTRFLTPETLEKLLGSVSAFAQALAQKAARSWTEGQVQALLRGHELSHERILSAYTEEPS